MKKKITLSLNPEIWKQYQIECLKKEKIPSHEIEKFMESEINGS